MGINLPRGRYCWPASCLLGCHLGCFHVMNTENNFSTAVFVFLYRHTFLRSSLSPILGHTYNVHEAYNKNIATGL